jgi:succinylglutamate desuccinylase
MIKKIIKISGQEKGNISFVMAGLHGNERCGVVALKEVISKIKIEKGVVFFALGNPKALEKNVRYTETDLNRMFREPKNIVEKESYEYQRAQVLKKYLKKSDALLDIHASSVPKSRPFIICEENAKEIIKNIPVKTVVSGFDEVEPGGSDYYMNRIGKIGICVECGYIKSKKSVEVAKESIISFLKNRNHIKGKLSTKKQEHFLIYEKYMTKTEKFVLVKPFENFESVLKGQVIGVDGKEEVKAKKDGFVLFAHNANKKGSEALLLGEKKSPV